MSGPLAGVTVQAALGTQPLSTSTPTYTPIGKIRKVQIQRGRTYEFGQVQSASATFTADNSDGSLTVGGSGLNPNVCRPIQAVAVDPTGPTAPIFTGFVYDWPIVWTDPALALTDIAAYDGFQLLQGQCKAVAVQECLMDSPLALYPCDDQSTVGGVRSVVGDWRLGQPYVMPDPTDPGFTPAVNFGQAPVTQEGASVGFSTNGLASAILNLGDPTSPGPDFDITAGLTMEAWVGNWTHGSSYATAPVLTVWDGSGGGILAALLVLNTGAVEASVAGPSGALAATSTVTVPTPGNHHLAFTINAAGTTLTLYVDGAVAATATGSGIGNWSTYRHPLYVQAGAQWTPLYQPNGSPVGNIGLIGIYLSALASTRIALHWQAGSTAFAGDLTGQRILRLLTYAGVPVGLTALQVGASQMQAATGLQGRTFLAAIQDVEASEGGLFYVSKAGMFTFHDRHDRLQRAIPTWSFGAAGIPFTGQQLSCDPLYIYNDVEVIRYGGIQYLATDTASRADYGLRSLSLTVYTESDQDAVDSANYLLSKYSRQHPRIKQLDVQPRTNRNALTFALGAEIGDRVTVTIPTVGQPNITIDGYIEGLKHTLNADSGDWSLTVLMSPSITDYWLLAASRTTLAATASGSSATVNATAGGSYNPPKAELPPGLALVFADTGEVARIGYITGTTAPWTTAVITFGDHLAAACLTSSTTLTVENGAAWTVGQHVGLGGSPSVTGIAGNTLTLSGAIGTAYPVGTFIPQQLAASHASGVQVYQPLPAGFTDPTTWDAFSVLGVSTQLGY